MAMEVMNSYGSYATQYMAGNSKASGTKKKIQNRQRKRRIVASQKVQRII